MSLSAVSGSLRPLPVAVHRRTTRHPAVVSRFENPQCWLRTQAPRIRLRHEHQVICSSISSEAAETARGLLLCLDGRSPRRRRADADRG